MSEFNKYFRPGFLEVFCGPMKSGKTLELMHRVERLKYMSGISIAYFKPSTDKRSKGFHSRFQNIENNCYVVDNSSEITDLIKDEKIVVMDEAQFFDDGICSVTNKLLDEKKNVIIAGLDLDFKGEPFGPMPNILALANEITKLSGICDYKGCNNPAYFTQRLINGEPASRESPLVLVGDKDYYETRCRKHHQVLE